MNEFLFTIFFMPKTVYLLYYYDLILINFNFKICKMRILGKFCADVRVQNVTWPRDRWSFDFRKLGIKLMRKTWKKKLMKRCVAISGSREAVADFVQGGGGSKLTPPPPR